MSLTIDIQSNTTRLERGKQVSVPVLIHVDEPQKIRGLHATFLGAEETKATYMFYNAATKSMQPQTATQQKIIAKEQHLLSGRDRMGFVGNLSDGLATILGAGRHEVLEPGDYSFDINLELPDDAPSTKTGAKFRVFYELAIRVDIPVAVDPKSVFSFAVDAPAGERSVPAGPRRHRYPEDQDKSIWDEWFGPDVSVDLAIEEGRLKRGDQINGLFVIQSARRLQIDSIKARIVGVESVVAQSHKDGHKYQGSAVNLADPGAIDGEVQFEFEIPVEFDGPGSCAGENFTMEWFVEFRLKVPGAKDPRVRLPIELVDDVGLE